MTHRYPKLELEPQPDASRRSIALSILGALSGAALLKGCAPGQQQAVEALVDEEPGSLSSTRAALTGSAIRWFDTKAELAAAAGSTNHEIGILLGYHSPGDGGGGLFYWDAGSSASDDGGTIIAATGGRWRRLADRDVVSVKWFGAKGDWTSGGGGTDDAAAINLALAASLDVYLPPGSFLVGSTLLLRDNQTLRGAGTTSSIVCNVAGGFGVTIKNVSHAEVRDLLLKVLPGSNGVRIEADGSAVVYPKVTSLLIHLPFSGATVGVAMHTNTATDGACVYNARIEDLQVYCFDGYNYPNTQATGVRVTSVSGAVVERNVGSRMTYGRIAHANVGVDLDHCDGFSVVGTTFDSLIGVNGVPANPAHSGRGIVFREKTRLCLATDNRFEDIDVFFENLGPGDNGLVSLMGFSPDRLLNTGGGMVQVSGLGTAASYESRVESHGRRHLFQRNIDLGYDDLTTWVSGTIQSAHATGGAVSPFIRIVGPTIPFALGSIYVEPVLDPNMHPSGELKYVFNTTSQPLTVKHQDSAASVPEERIYTLTGADIVVPGPAVLRFIYDVSWRGGYGYKRWIYIGAS